MSQPIPLIRFDWAIKKILRSRSNFNILEGFLSELLGEDIVIQELLESETLKEDSLGKFNRMDLLAKNSQGDLVLIEVQVDSQQDFLSRLLFGATKILAENMQKSQPYAQLKRVYVIGIIYFNLGSGDDYIYHGTTQFTGWRNKTTLAVSPGQKKLYASHGVHVNKISDMFPEYFLIKANGFPGAIKDGLDEWIYFLKNDSVLPEFKAKGLKEAIRALNVLKLNKDEKVLYEQHMKSLSIENSVKGTWIAEGEITGFEKGHAQGIAEGVAKGAVEGDLNARLEIYRSLLASGMSPEQARQIAKIPENT